MHDEDDEDYDFWSCHSKTIIIFFLSLSKKNLK